MNTKLMLGKEKNMDANAKEAYGVINSIAKKEISNIAFWTETEYAPRKFALVKGKRATVIKCKEVETSKFEVFVRILGVDSAGVCIMREGISKQNAYMAVTRALSLTDETIGIKPIGKFGYDCINDGFRDFFAKQMFSCATDNKWNAKEEAYYTPLFTLYYNLAECECMHNMARMYFHGDIDLFEKSFCIPVFGQKFAYLPGYLCQRSKGEVMYLAVKNILNSYKYKLEDVNCREKISKIVEDNTFAKKAFLEVIA